MFLRRPAARYRLPAAGGPKAFGLAGEERGTARSNDGLRRNELLRVNRRGNHGLRIDHLSGHHGVSNNLLHNDALTNDGLPNDSPRHGTAAEDGSVGRHGESYDGNDCGGER